jgi:hypothetical protein
VRFSSCFTFLLRALPILIQPAAARHFHSHSGRNRGYAHPGPKPRVQTAPVAWAPTNLRAQPGRGCVQLGYVSHQLGHADVATTSRHYARWCGGSEYREAMTPTEGELPADLLARISEKAPQSPHSDDVELDTDLGKTRDP